MRKNFLNFNNIKNHEEPLEKILLFYRKNSKKLVRGVCYYSTK